MRAGAKGGDPAGDHAETECCGNRPPGGGAPKRLLGDDRPERLEGRDDREEDRRRPDDDHPEPGAGDELAPATCELGEKTFARAFPNPPGNAEQGSESR